MIYKQNLNKAAELKMELDSYRPIKPEVEKRIMQKLRLDWNYHSSHIEGNQLTYGETKALILFGHTANAKPLKDHLEMAGHNEAIQIIEDVVQQKRPLIENSIRELHNLILKEPFEVDAITPDGKPTKRIISVGKYKTVPNHVKTIKDEILYFATPEETPAKMKDLMDWYNQNIDKNEIHPILLASEFHYRFIRIHPFDDGNGRIARLLMNFLLMQKGYPPAIIKTESKNEYYAALQQADAGNIEYFFNYICEQVICSLEIMIKGAKGENIDEEEDLDKKLALLKQKIDTEDNENEIRIKLTVGTLQKILETWGYFFLTELAKTTAKFNEFYTDPKHFIRIDFNNFNNYIEFEQDPNFEEIKEAIAKREQNTQLSEVKLCFQSSFGAYKKGGLKPFMCSYIVEVKLELFKYEISVGSFIPYSRGQNTKSIIKRLLHKPLSTEEIKQICKDWGDSLYQHLEFHIKTKNEY